MGQGPEALPQNSTASHSPDPWDMWVPRDEVNSLAWALGFRSAHRLGQRTLLGLGVPWGSRNDFSLPTVSPQTLLEDFPLRGLM